MNEQALTQLIKKRRSIYPPMYNGKPISKETILKILENACWAPNHKKTEPWRFRVYRGDTLQDLSDYLGSYYTAHTPEELFSDVKYKKTIKKPLQSAAVIAIIMHNGPAVTIPEWEEVAAVACAVQNMWLTCTAMGIGAYWSSPKSIIEAKDFLNLGEHEKCLGLFYMGYTDIEDLPAQRISAIVKTEWA